MLVFLHPRVSSRVSGFPVASPCLWGKLQNVSFCHVANCENCGKSRTKCWFFCIHVSCLESLVFLWRRRVYGGSWKTCPFRMSPSKLSCRFAWQAWHFVTFQPVWWCSQNFKIGGSLVRNAGFSASTCLISSRWFSCGVAVSMGEAGKHVLFECVQAGCHVVLRGRRGTLWHSNLFDNVWKISKLEEVSHEMLVFLHPRVSSRVSGFPVASPCLWEKLRTPHSTLYTPHSTYTLDSTLYTLHSALYTLHFPPQSSPETLHSTLHTLHYTLHFPLLTPHSTLYTPHSTLYTLHSTLHTLHYTLFTLHSTLHTPHFPLHTPHSTLYTPHSTRFTPHSTLYTPHFTLHTLHFTLHTLHPILHTLHFTLYTPHFTLYTPPFPLYSPHSTLYTPHSILYTLHSILHTLHFTLRILHFTHSTLPTPHFTLHTPYFTLHTPHSTLSTPHCRLVTRETCTRLFK